MKKWLFLLIIILPQLLKAGTTVIHIETEGWGTVTNVNGDTINTNGAMFWNGTKWVTNETAAHMFFTDLRTGKRLKDYNVVNVSDRTAISPVFDSLSYHITRQNYHYAYPAKQGGTYQYEAVEYLIGDTTAKKVVIRSRGTGNGTGNCYFDIFVGMAPNLVTAIRNDPQWFAYPDGMTMGEALNQNSPTQYLAGSLAATDGYYFMDVSGGSDMGGTSYNFHTGPLTGNPNTNDLGPSYPIDFMLKFTDGTGQLQEFKFLPQLISETYISPKPPTVSTGEILDLKTDSVLLLGNVTDDGSLASTIRGVVYSTSSQPTLESGTAVADTAEGTGEFSVVIPGLIPNTTYFVRVYATNQGGTVYGETRRFTTPESIKDIAVGSLPQNLAVNHKTNNIYVANNIGNSVSVINGETGNNDDTISVGKAPYYVGINEKTNKIYVPNNSGNTVSVIKGANNEVETTIAVGIAPRAAVVNETTNKIYVPADYSTNPGKVYVINGETNTVEDTVTVGWRPIAAAVNKTTNKIYVANNNSKSVTVIDGATGHTETLPAGNSPRYISINDSTNRVYVVNYRDSSITVIDGKTNLTDTIRLAQNAYPWAAAVNRLTNKIYVSNSGTNTVTVIDGETNAIKNISVGKAPQAIAVNEATNRIYVGNYNSDSRSNAGYVITEIDGATDEIVGLACVKNPAELAVNIRDNKTYIINGDQVKSIEECKPIITVSPDSLEFASAGGSASFRISSNIAWRIVSNQTWVTLSDTTGTGNRTVTVKTKANTLSSERRATITIFMGYDADTLSVKIIQKGAATLSVSTNTLNIAAANGSTASFNVTSNSSWTATSNQTWLSVNPATDTGNGSVTVTAEANPTTSTRTATVIVSGSGVTSQTVTVTQAAGAATLSVSTNTLNVASANGSTASFNVTSNINWTATSNQTWLSVNPATGIGNGTVTVTAEVNPTISTRTATVTVSGSGVTSQSVTITQSADAVSLTVSPLSLDVAAAEGSSAIFTITSNTGWVVLPNETWLKVSKPFGSGNSEVMVIAEANPTTSQRTGTLVVSATGAGTQTVTVTQAAGAVTLTVSPSTIDIAAMGGDTTITITSNTSWTVTSDQSWLSVTPVSGSGNGTVTVTADANPLSSARSAIVTVSATGAVSHTVVISQPGTVGVLADELAKIRVYPNPFSDGFYVDGFDHRDIVSLFAPDGRRIFRKEMSSAEFVPAKDLMEGIYVVKITNSSSTIIRKIIKH